MKVGCKNVGVFINGSVLYNGFGTSLYVEQLVQPVVQKVYLQIEAPSGHVFIKVEQVRVVINVFELWDPLIVFAEQLAEDMVKFITPIREKAKAIYNDEDYLKQVMARGAAKARESAQLTMEKVKRAMGLDYF